MARIAPERARRVCCIGTGTVGGGWVAHFLRRGYRVTAWDPAPDAAARLDALLDAAWPALEALGFAEGAARSRLTFADSLAAAVADAEFIQESAPERLDLKVPLLAAIDAAAPPECVVASSTSGLSISALASRARRPGRLVAGHPFNPPYLMPLVEVVGGERTDPAAVAWASGFYAAAGKTVVTLAREVPGFIANRLQAALGREALHMLAADEATVEQIDRAITAGPGLRWPVSGPLLTNHLNGGAGGIAATLDHYDFQSDMSRLLAPPLTDDLKRQIVAGCERAYGGRSLAELIGWRDRCLIAIQRALAAEPFPGAERPAGELP